MIRTRLALLLCVLVMPASAATNAILTTSTSSAVTASQTSIRLASTAGINAPSPIVPGSAIYVVDSGQTVGEAMPVLGVSGQNVSVRRGASGTIASAHAAGATVYVATNASWFYTTDPQGPCVAAQVLVSPWLNITNGAQWVCSGGTWALSTSLSVGIIGTSNQITVTGTCSGTTIISCTLSIPSDFRLPGTINKVTLTQPATGSTITVANGATLTASNTVTFTGTDGSSVAFGTGGTMVYTSSKLSAFAATSSSELAGVISDETGSGSLVFGTSPTLSNPIVGTQTQGDNSTKAASTAYVDTAVAGAGDGDNIPIGLNALNTITGIHNVAIGGGAASTGSGNGYDNVLVGYDSAAALTSGFRNVCVGGSACLVLTSGDKNTATGFFSGVNLSTGESNAFFGYDAGFSVSSGSGNVMAGFYSGVAPNSITGNNNIAMGAETANNLLSGSDNVMLGYRADLSDSSSQHSNSIAIGNAAKITCDNCAIIGASGVTDVYFGSSSATAKIYAGGIQSGGSTFTLSGACSTGTAVGGATAGTFVSSTTGSCTAVVTMGSSMTATTGWACGVSNRTTANLIRQTASSTTTATFVGTTVANDVISFNCMAY